MIVYLQKNTLFLYERIVVRVLSVHIHIKYREYEYIQYYNMLLCRPSFTTIWHFYDRVTCCSRLSSINFFSIKCRHFRRNNFFLLILRVFISFTKQFFTFKVFHISLGVVRSLPWGPRGLVVRRLPRMQEVVGSNPTEGKICLLHFTLLEWNVKNCFVKLIKTLKLTFLHIFI